MIHSTVYNSRRYKSLNSTEPKKHTKKKKYYEYYNKKEKKYYSYFQPGSGELLLAWEDFRTFRVDKGMKHVEDP